MPLDPSIWNPGLAGPPGEDGNTILHGSGAPSDSIGVDNDFYIDTLTYDLYGPKTGGVWTTYVSLVGPAGADGVAGVKGDKGDPGPQGTAGVAGANGATILAGLGAPDAGDGVNGDYYFDTVNKDLYGPKTAGAWGVPTSLNGEDAVVQEAAYGQLIVSVNTDAIAFTAASPTDLTDNTDYIQITGIFDAIPHGLNNQFTQGTNSLTCNRAGKYMIHLWASLTSDTNATNMAFKFAVNGTIAPQRRPWRFVRNVGEIHSVSAFGFIELAAGDVITLWAAADKNCNITIQDSVFALTELAAAGHHMDIYDESVLTVEDAIGINFVGAGVTVTEDPTGVANVTIPGSTAVPVEVMDEGVSLTTAVTKLDFAGAGVTVTESAPDEILITIPGGGGGGGGAGKLATLPSGARIFDNHIAAWGSGAFGTSGRIYTWITEIDDEVIVTGIEYAIISTLNSAGADIYFELHEVLGHGAPGPCVASVQVDVSTAGDSRTVNFASPVTIPAGYYFASLCVNTEGTQAPGFGVMTTLTAAANARKSALLISDYWLWLRATAENNVVYFLETHLPGGAFTPNSDWTGTSLQFADVVQYTSWPHIGLIKQ